MATNRQQWKPKHQVRGKIQVSKDGPFIVTGGIPLARWEVVTDSQGYPRSWRKVEDYVVENTYSLCRCGQSKNLPFCDGSHSHCGFVGTETAGHETYLDQADETVGPALDLTDAHAFCIGIGFCDRAGGTWTLTEESADPASRRIALEEASNCPSGRLVAWDKKGQSQEPDFEPSIAIVEDPEVGMRGPIWVRGGVPIESADGHPYEIRNRATLCGCGRSCNKPFCDGGHVEASSVEEIDDDDTTELL